MLTELWSELRYRVRALFFRDAIEQELDAELRFHIGCEAEKYERLGVPREEALRRARLVFGGVDRIKEESRDVRGTVLLESLVQDVRYAVRGVRAKPGFAAGVALTLALGIGANSAMFGIFDRLLLRPPAYLRDADRVHRVYMAWEDAERTPPARVTAVTSIARYLDFVRNTHSFAPLVGFRTSRIAVGDGQASREFPVAGVSAGYFALFDMRPAFGRFFTASEDAMPTGSPVVVLGHAYWRSQLGGRPDVLGRTLRVGRTLFTIVGVAPEQFAGLDGDVVPAMYLPLTAFAWNARPEDHSSDYHWQVLQLAARRPPGVSLAEANADLTAAFQRSWIARGVAESRPSAPIASARPHAMLGPIQLERGPLAGPESRVVVWVMGVAVIVLLIACANVASLLLARAVTRHRETALRLALGVSRGRLARQLVTESLVLALLGGSVGLVAAQWGGAAVRALLLPEHVGAATLVDGRTLVVTCLTTVLAALVTGLAPVAQALRHDLAHSLGAGGRDAGARPTRAHSVLLLFQATLSVVLLVWAGLFVRSLQNVRSLPLGYDVDPVLVVTDELRGVKLTPAENVALEHRLSDAARAIPGVVSATPAPSVPFWGYEGRALFVVGVDSVSALGSFVMQAGNADYFRTVGTRILRGRGFGAQDGASSPRVAVVSEGMARALWPARDPLGQCLRIGADTAPCTLVVGVAEEVRISSLSSQREYTYYVPVTQYGDPTGTLLVRVAGDAAGYVETVRRELQRLMPGTAYVNVVPLRSMVSPKLQSWRIGATMLTAFGALALVLAAIGLYSVIAYRVLQRRREIGVRMALGASPRSVTGLVVRGGLRLVVAGVLLGSTIAASTGPWLGALLFNVSPTDPVVYIAVAAVLALVTLAASALPALSAARVDPVVALREE